jgi:FG-GAP-like repeat
LKTKFQFLLIAWALLTASYHLFAQDTHFELSSSNNVGSQPHSVCAADVNGDGKLDLISANFYGGTLTVLTNDGNGGFVLAFTTPYIGQPISVCAADVNGDGKVDLICANFGNPNGPYNNTLIVLTNDGVGGFEFASAPVVGSGPDSVCAADVNGDGKMDLICANGGDETLTVLTNDGKGNFARSSLLPGGYSSECVIAADVNADGKVDLVCANYESPLMIYTNDGIGGFGFASQYDVGGADCVVAADVNGDGKVDLICSDYAGLPPLGYTNYSYLMILTNDGSGNFQLSSSLYVLGSANSVCAADVTGDGKMDLITANSAYYESIFGGNYVANALTVFTNDGSGNFAFAASPSVGIDPWWVIAADVNGDGKMDLISANLDNTLTVLTNATIFSPPTFTPPLTIKPSGLGMQISWPSDSPGWSLQQNPDLTTANWGPSGYSGFNISDDGTNKSLTMPSSSGNLFFRLLHP